MMKLTYRALISLAALAVALWSAGPAGASARHDGRHHQGHQQAGKRTHQRARAARGRARASRRASRRAAAYVCPMHPDIRERARGTCPKCLMELVAEPRGTKSSGPQVKERGVGAGAPTSGGM